MKDLFSHQAENYSRYRPIYPKECIDLLCSLCQNADAAWDAGTGNGQLAVLLSTRFRHIYATDISSEQLKNANIRKNISYLLESSERTSIPGNSVDLVTAAQAAHWLDMPKFSLEIQRVARQNSAIALLGYDLPMVSQNFDHLLRHFYSTTLNKYWEPERSHIDNHYREIHFPFHNDTFHEMEMMVEWTFKDFIGYLRTWSAVKKYQTENSTDPILLVENELMKFWPGQNNSKNLLRFPLFIRTGSV